MENEILDLAKKLIEFKTITGNTKEVGDCYDFINSYFAPEIFAGKIIVKKYNNCGFRSMIFSCEDVLKFDVILNGHIDVVGAEDKDFIPIIKEGRLYARGAADMKSQVAIMMVILKEAVNKGTKKSLALMLTSDEEVGGKSGVDYLLNDIGYTAKIAFTPDGGENFELNIKEKGVLWIKIVAEGKTTHGSRPWLGDNAVLKLIRFYREIEKKFPPFGKNKALYKDGVSVNLGKIQGGKSVNTVPENAEMYLDFRYSERTGKKKILAAAKKLAGKTGLKFEIIEDAGVGEIDPENYYLKKFKKITEKEIGRKMKIIRSTGSSGTHFFSAKNIPTIITSPNYGNIHGTGEWVKIGDLEKLYNIINQFIIEINKNMEKKNNKRVFSAIQPSGELHIGNYLGALKNFIELQDKYDCFFFIADYHSITENYDPKEKPKQIMNLALDMLATGLDPEKCIIAKQSDICEHTELAWILNTITPMGLLERMTQYKDKASRQKENINVGLFDYPVLQAADILIYKAGLVPVGQDQIQHLELSRNIAHYFNNKFGETFSEPQPILTKAAKIFSITDPTKKMSKSLGQKSYIGINDSPETIKEKMKKAVTDTGTSGKITPATENLFLLLKILGKPEHYKEFLAEHKKGTIKYSQLKEILAMDIADYFAPFRAKRQELAAKPEYVKKILADGAEKARIIARETIKEVKEKIGLTI